MYVTTTTIGFWLVDEIKEFVHAVGGPLAGLLKAVLLVLGGILVSLLGAAAGNDVWQAMPRVTRWLLRWSARLRYGDTERAATRAEEQAAGIEATKLHLPGLAQALGFAGAAIIRRCWALVREPAARKRIDVPSPVRTPVPAGQHVDADITPTELDEPDEPDAPPGPGRFRIVVAGIRIASKALMVAGLVLVALTMVAGLAALWSAAGTDLEVAYASGDEPEYDRAPSGCVRSPCPPGPSSDNWELTSGGSIDTTYTSRNTEVDTLAGDLQLLAPSCARARVEWRITADGATVAEGTLAEGDSEDLRAFEVPAHRAADSLTIAAHRRDDHSCTAHLSWTEPGYETPGAFAPLATAGRR